MDKELKILLASPRGFCAGVDRAIEIVKKTLKKSCEDQKKGITTFIEVILNQELGEPFRRDAMKKPVKVAGINPKDMRQQQNN